jgi:small conductance mechanosensitive channel
MLFLSWVRDPGREVVASVPRLTAGVLIMCLSWILSIWLEQSAAHLLRRRSTNRDITELLGQALRATVLAVGLLTAWGTLGIDTGALTASLGTTGFALGFAVKGHS